MLRVPVSQIEPGMLLARPISCPDNPRQFLLPRDYEIPMGLVPKLSALGLAHVWVRYSSLDFLDDTLDQGLEEEQRRWYHQIRESCQKIMHGSVREMDLHRFRSTMQSLFDLLKNNPPGQQLLPLIHRHDDRLLTHSANVCYLALLLFVSLISYIKKERVRDNDSDDNHLELLSLGCLFHDVGKLKIPQRILNKKSALNYSELKTIRQHPILGYEMVKGLVPPAVAEVVLNHHQLWNGSGYPERLDPRTGEALPGLSGKQISIFSRITTMVDIYDAATSQRCYASAKPSVQVLHEMRTDCQGFFDPIVEDAFFQVVPPFCIGQLVELSNGMAAVVVELHTELPDQPKVQIFRDPHGHPYQNPAIHEIDLSCCDNLHIAFVDGVDVRPFLASPSDRKPQITSATHRSIHGPADWSPRTRQKILRNRPTRKDYFHHHS